MAEQQLHPYEDAEEILKKHDAIVSRVDHYITTDGERVPPENEGGDGWSLGWENGGIGWLRPDWTQEQANRAGAMFIYLWLKGVGAQMSEQLAELYAEHARY